MNTQHLEFLTRLPLMLNSSLSQTIVISRALHFIKDNISAEAATVFLLEPDKFELVFWATGEGDKDTLEGQRIPAGQGVVGWVIENQKSQIVADAQNDPRFFKHVDKESGFVTKNILCVPLTATGKRVIGAVQVLNKTAGGFTEEDLDFVEHFCAQVGLAIENARLYEELQTRNEKLQKLDRRKSEMLSVLTHEFRTPFSLIQTSADILHSGMLKDEKAQKQMYETLIEGTLRLTRLLGQMKNLSLASSGDIEVKKETIDLVTLFSELKDGFKEPAAKRDISIEYLARDDARVVLADRINIAVVMRNLITNAIKFTPDGGHVYVTSEPKTGRVELEVRDTGIGISADEQNAVFEKFYEVRDHLNHNSGTFDFKGGGLGLGLSTVKAILNAHGSGISLKSEPGKGSSFSFCLDSA